MNLGLKWRKGTPAQRHLGRRAEAGGQGVILAQAGIYFDLAFFAWQPAGNSHVDSSFGWNGGRKGGPASPRDAPHCTPALMDYPWLAAWPEDSHSSAHRAFNTTEIGDPS